MRAISCSTIALLGLVLFGCKGDVTPAPSSGSATSTPGTSPAGTSDPTAAMTAPSREPVPAKIQDGIVTITPQNSKVMFVGTKPDGKHEGGFQKFEGKIEMATGDLSMARISIEFDMESTWTDDPRLTQHLLSPDFFEARTYPKAQFVSTKVEPGDSSGNYLVSGDFTLHGATKPITCPTTITVTGDELTLRSQFTINRSDFGITYGPGRVDEQVSITVAVGGLGPDDMKTAATAPGGPVTGPRPGPGIPGGQGPGPGFGPGGYNPGDFFKRLDNDSDQRLTNEELGSFADRLLKADADKDGIITKEEFDQSLARRASEDDAPPKADGAKEAPDDPASNEKP